MASGRKKPLTDVERERIRSELRRDVAARQSGYRERALKLFPHLCASCGREFSDARLKELTVHHKDHDHSRNPPDGSNWELLCIYCHDHEHEKQGMAGYGGGGAPADDAPAPSTLFNPFAALDVKPPADRNGDKPK